MKERLIEKHVAGHKCYFFDYKTSGGEMGFRFSMPCEVGQPYIPVFERMIREQGLDLVTMEINETPWVITVKRPEHYPKQETHIPMGGWNPQPATAAMKAAEQIQTKGN